MLKKNYFLLCTWQLHVVAIKGWFHVCLGGGHLNSTECSPYHKYNSPRGLLMLAMATIATWHSLQSLTVTLWNTNFFTSISPLQTRSFPSGFPKQMLLSLPILLSFPQRSAGLTFHKEDCTHLGLAVSTRTLHAHSPPPPMPTGAQWERRTQLIYWETSNFLPPLFS